MDFDQAMLIDNVYRLIEERGETIKSFEEKEMKVSVGYLSKLRKGSLDAGPKISLELLLRITNYFGVSLEYLLINPHETSADCIRLAKLFDRLRSDTVAETLVWNCGDWETLWDPKYDNDPLSLSQIHPIIKVEDDWDENGTKRISKVTVSSWHFAERSSVNDVRVKNFCSTNLESVDSQIFLYQVDYFSKENIKTDESIIEAYLLDGESQRFFLGDTTPESKNLRGLIQDLYKCARLASNQKKLDSRARTLIDRFNNTKLKGGE